MKRAPDFLGDCWYSWYMLVFKSDCKDILQAGLLSLRYDFEMKSMSWKALAMNFYKEWRYLFQTFDYRTVLGQVWGCLVYRNGYETFVRLRAESWLVSYLVKK